MISLVPLVLCSGLASAATWVVDPTGGGDTITIAEGAALLQDGDRLEIRAGTYYEDSINISEENVQIVGDGADVTLMVGSSPTRPGFRIAGGSELSDIGFQSYAYSAIVVKNSNDDAATIDIHDIEVWQGDWGVMTDTSASTVLMVSHSSFGDMTSVGVGTYMFAGDLTVEGCVFRDATVGVLFGSGYDDALGDGSAITVVGNTMVSSRLLKTYTDRLASAYAYNNIIAGSMYNTWSIDSNTSGEIANNLIGADVTVSGSNNSSTMDDTSNLTGDPMFVDRTDDGDATNDDLRLLLGSAAIDVAAEGYATLTTDLDGTTRPVDGDDDGTALPDAGAYEFVRVDEDGDGELADTVGGDDCDDSEPTILPGAEEICGDGVDQDCDEVDPACPEDTGDTGTPPDTAALVDTADSAVPLDTAAPEDSAVETGQPITDTGEGKVGVKLAERGVAPRCGCNGQGALWLWPGLWLVRRRRREATPPNTRLPGAPRRKSPSN